jgi:hypothetical protein
MVVKNHSHSSSDVQEVVSSTLNKPTVHETLDFKILLNSLKLFNWPLIFLCDPHYNGNSLLFFGRWQVLTLAGF